MSKRTLLALFVSGLSLLLTQPKTFAASKPTLAGSWELTFTPTAPPTPPVIIIPGLATFTADGSTIETDGTEVAPGPSPSANAVTYGTPGHGIWQLLPSMTGFYVEYTSLSVNPDGSLNSKSVTVATVALSSATNATSFAGQYTTTSTSSSGSVPKTTTGTLSGTLIPHPKLP